MSNRSGPRRQAQRQQVPVPPSNDGGGATLLALATCLILIVIGLVKHEYVYVSAGIVNAVVCVLICENAACFIGIGVLMFATLPIGFLPIGAILIWLGIYDVLHHLGF